MGKIWDLAQLERRTEGAVYDLAIVDAPATGHGLAMLRAPSTYAGVARVGPIRRQALIIDEFVRDADATGVLAVALPEEIPVNETIELEGRLRDELGMELDAIVVNAVYPQRFSAADARRLAALDGRGSGRGARRRPRRAVRGAPRPRRALAGRAPAARGRARPCSRSRSCSSRTSAAAELERLARVLERRL